MNSLTNQPDKGEAKAGTGKYFTCGSTQSGTQVCIWANNIATAAVRALNGSSGGWFVSHVLLRLFEVNGEVDRCDRLDLSKLQPIDVSVDRLRAAVIALLVRFERRHRAARPGLKPERFHQ